MSGRVRPAGRIAGLVAGCFSLVASAAAQIAPPRVPTPDSIMQENRRQLEDRSRVEAPAVAPRLVEPPAPPPTAGPTGSDLRFRLDGISFDSSAYLSADSLDAMAKPLVGTEIGIDDLQALVAKINAAYQAMGVPTARALLPPQDIKGGKVRISLIEGRIGSVTAEGGSPGTQRRAVAAVPAPGALADPRAIESRLHRYNIVNDTQLQARLAEGTRAGETDVVVVPDAPRHWGVELFVDNNGFRSTGTGQGGGVLRGFRLLNAADRATLAYSHASGVDSGSLSWGTPFAEALRIDLTASFGATRLYAGENRDVRVTGKSRTFGGTVTGLVHVSRRNVVQASLGVQSLYSTTDVAGPRALTNVAWQTSGGLSWAWTGAGVAASLQAELTGARVHERVSDTSRDIGLVRGAGNFNARLGDTALQARLRGDWQVGLADDLPGFLLYQIGGLRSNRGWSPGAAAGDSGGSATAELAYTRAVGTGGAELMAFVDHAQVKAPGSFVSLQSAGVGVAASFGAATLRASFARGIGWHGLPRSDEAFVAFNFRF